MLIEPLKNMSPDTAYAALRRLGPSFLINGSAATGRRYSYAGAAPIRTMEAGCAEDPFAALSGLLSSAGAQAGPFPFSSGAVGYFSYDLKSVIEPALRFRHKEGPAIPGCMAGIYDPVFVFDHHEEKGYLVSLLSGEARFSSHLAALRAAQRRQSANAVAEAGPMRADVTRQEYLDAVRRAKAYISEGDIYQINLSQRITIPWAGDAFGLYLALLENYPAPQSSFLDMGGFQLISNSPEQLLAIEGTVASTRPIKGTRRRGADRTEDAALVAELKASPKERAEHVMIVDLERSDLGKVCMPGTVEVAGFEEVESYPHLHHMASTVRGRLREGVDAPAALKAIFPGGSITGAPKARAMEIIDELERSARSIYTGGIGWFGLSGGCEVAVAIRTALYKDGILTLWVGGGIVADSVPEDEYEETLLKARDFLGALGKGA